MRKLVLKIILLALPILLLIGLFFVADPFRIVHTYADYSRSMFVIPNRDFVSTQMYRKNADTQGYDAFVFGSSRTIAFKTKSWRKKLPTTAKPFVFDASGESIFGIYTKIAYLDKTHAPLNHCLLIFCTDCTFARETDHTEHLGIKHPAVAGTSWLRFYGIFLRDFLDNRFLKNYIQFLITKTYVPSMKGFIEIKKSTFDPITNDEWLVDQEKELQQDPKGYYEARKAVFYPRKQAIRPAKPQITDKQRRMLVEMAAIFRKHQTDFKIVISPLYDQIRLNASDLATLQTIFGPNRVYDFSGKNAWTEDRRNYYESSHYRPFIGDSILNILYP
jgi:hypothetical protein